MLNPETHEKKMVEGYSAWFDSVNQFHGSIRVTAPAVTRSWGAGVCNARYGLEGSPPIATGR